MKKTIIITMLVLVAFVAVRILIPRPNMRQTDKPMALSDFTQAFGDYHLPGTASNILLAQSSVGLGGRCYALRFDAPHDSLVQFAKQEFARYNELFYGSPTNFPSDELVSLAQPPEKPDLSAYGYKELGWFNINDVTNGVTIQRVHSHHPFIVIDNEHHRLYTWRTD